MLRSTGTYSTQATVYVDSTELGAPYLEYLSSSKETAVVFKRLAAGDILVNGLGIERKTVQDFFLTLKEGRLFGQLRRLKQVFTRQLLVTGRDNCRLDWRSESN